MVKDTELGEEIRARIEEVGGLASLMDLAREWEVSRTRIHQLARRSDFPAPVGEVATGSGRAIKLYARADAQRWRDTPRNPGRPRKRNPRPKDEC